MKVKTLLSTLQNVEYILMAESEGTKEINFIGNKYYGESNFEDSQVVKITTVKDCEYIVPFIQPAVVMNKKTKAISSRLLLTQCEY